MGSGRGNRNTRSAARRSWARPRGCTSPPHIEGDDELKARLARHRRDQDAAWKLVEAPPKILSALDADTLAGHGAAVLDRFTVWLSNRLAISEANADYDLIAEVETLADRLYRSTIADRPRDDRDRPRLPARQRP